MIPHIAPEDLHIKVKQYVPPADFLDLLLDAVCVVDPSGHFVFVSAAFERIFGYAPEEVIGKRMINLVLPDDRPKTRAIISEIMAGHPQFNFENRYVRKDGRVVHVLWSARLSEADQLRIAVGRDITERKQAEVVKAAVYAISEAAHAAEDLVALFQSIHKIISGLLHANNFSVAMLDENCNLTFPYQSEAYSEKSEIRLSAIECFCSEVIRTGQSILLGTEDLKTLPDHLAPVAGWKALCWLGVPLRSHKKAIGALLLKTYSPGNCYTENDKELLQFVSTQVVTAIDRKQAQARLQHMAQYDQLTDLPNRGFLYDRLEMALARARRKESKLAILYIDLDNFKKINDSYGHAAGDILLREVAKRLKDCLRESDTVARIGGDEFVILLENVEASNCVAAVARKIRHAVTQPTQFNDNVIEIQLSIGTAHYPENGNSAELLLRHADEAMYARKKSAENLI